jgi:hypothetical protein
MFTERENFSGSWNAGTSTPPSPAAAAAPSIIEAKMEGTSTPPSPTATAAPSSIEDGSVAEDSDITLQRKIHGSATQQGASRFCGLQPGHFS